MSASTVSNYAISEVAKFFGKSIAWIRWKERSGVFVREDGTMIEPARTNPRRANEGQRRYSLQDIEEMAQALLRKGDIKQEDYDNIHNKVAAFSD